jgi:hypothetical protein
VSNKLASTKFRKLIPGRCNYCSRQFFSHKRTGRPQLFCDKRCRDGKFRRSRYLRSKNGESVSKKASNAKGCKDNSGCRPLPLNILGGHRWANSARIDRELLGKIIRTEIGGEAVP